MDKVSLPLGKNSEEPRYNILPTMKEDFCKKVCYISKELGLNPDWLMAVMYMESRFNPNAKNPNSTAKGLLQWIDSTSKSNFGIPSAEIPTNPLRQLDFVYDYFKGRLSKTKPQTFLDFYLMVFYPKAVNKPGNFKFSEQAVEKNKGLFGYFKDDMYGTKADMEAKIFKSEKIPVFSNLLKKEGGGEYYATISYLPKSKDYTIDQVETKQVGSLKGYTRALENGKLESA